MRWFSGVLLLIAVAVPAAWMSGETLLARKAARLISEDARIEAQSVGAIREWWRLGLNLSEVRFDTPDGQAAIPHLKIWAEAVRLNEVHMNLPPRMTLPIAGRARVVTADGTTLSLRVAPFGGMALTRAVATSGPVSIDGERVLGKLSAQVQMVMLEPDAPRDAGVAYQVTLQASDMSPAPLDPQIATLPAAVDIDGAARLWMTEPFGGMTDGAGPQLSGVSSDGITVRLGNVSARILGRVEADAQGFAQGVLNIYTADARGFLNTAAQAGVIPTGSVMLASALLTGLGTEPGDGTTPTQDAVPGDDTAAGSVPLPQNGELRLPIIMQGGRATLRGIPLGPAPRLR